MRIDLGVQGLARIRFAVSPLRVASELLYVLGHTPHLLGRQWRGLAVDVLRSRHLALLSAVAAGQVTAGYSPDFICPQPSTFDNDIDDELHKVATTGTRRVGYEMAIATDGRCWPGNTTATSGPAVLRDAAERGEQHLAEALAAQLQQFWNQALAPHWPRIQKLMEDDISQRATMTAREGLHRMIGGLDRALACQDSGLDIDLPGHIALAVAPAAILSPSVFMPTLMYTIDPDTAPTPRLPMITYPAIQSPASSPDLEELIGATRARLLAVLTTPQTTSELAERLHLSRSTVSYHLQILHRAGLVRRARNSLHVRYQKIQGVEPGLIGV